MIPPIPAMRYPALDDPPPLPPTPYQVATTPELLAQCRVRLLAAPLPTAWDGIDVEAVAHPFDATLTPGSSSSEITPGKLAVLECGLTAMAPPAGGPWLVYGLAVEFPANPPVELGAVDCPVPYVIHDGETFSSGLYLILQVAES